MNTNTITLTITREKFESAKKKLAVVATLNQKGPNAGIIDAFAGLIKCDYSYDGNTLTINVTRGDIDSVRAYIAGAMVTKK